MVGPARNVKGGMTTVVDNYFNYGLTEKVELKYIESCTDSNVFSKLLKEIKGYCEYKREVNKYDIVHIHMASRRSTFRKGRYVRLAKKLNKKVILHIHGAEYKMFYEECNKTQKKYVKKTLELADKIIVLSEEWQEYFNNLCNPKKITVLYNAVNLPDDFKKDLDNHDMLFLGKIGDRKGIFDLLEVIEMLKKDYHDLHLYVGGDGEIDRLKKYIQNHHLNRIVDYIGWINGLKKDELLKKCSYYILPSYNEGMPMSVLEAMAYKNVTISTNVGGIPKVITNNYNGIIINPGDKDDLYINLKKALENIELKKKLSDNAYLTIKDNFSIFNHIEKLLDIYKNISKEL